MKKAEVKSGKRADLASDVAEKMKIKANVSDKSAPSPLDRVNRHFKAPAPNMLWLSDFTYVATWQAFVYVAFVIDAFARRVVGWRQADCPCWLCARCSGVGIS